MCEPVRGKGVLLWLNVESVQTSVSWHSWHVVGKPAAACAGLVVPA